MPKKPALTTNEQRNSKWPLEKTRLRVPKGFNRRSDYHDPPRIFTHWSLDARLGQDP